MIHFDPAFLKKGVMARLNWEKIGVTQGFQRKTLPASDATDYRTSTASRTTKLRQNLPQASRQYAHAPQAMPGGGGAPSGSSAVKIHVPDDGPNGRRMPTSSKRLWTHSPSQPHECRPSSLRPRRETAEGHPRSNSSRFSNHIFKIQEETYHRTTRIMPSIPLIGSSSRSKVGP